MLTIEELRQYEWVQFYDCRTNLKDKKTGAKVGDYLVITGYGDKWKIFNIYGGLPIADVWINSLADAVKIAQAIEKVYGEYLSIWQIWTDVDLIAVARLSVPNGEAIYETICDIREIDKDTSYADFEKIYKEKLLLHKK